MTLKFAVLTISDRSSRGERPDTSGPALVELIQAQGWQVSRQEILPDDFDKLRETLSVWTDEAFADVILTTGCAGFDSR